MKTYENMERIFNEIKRLTYQWQQEFHKNGINNRKKFDEIRREIDKLKAEHAVLKELAKDLEK